jgi:hypothetical protein
VVSEGLLGLFPYGFDTEDGEYEEQLTGKNMTFQMFVSGEGLAAVCTENHVGIRFEWFSTRKETVGYKKVATKGG